MKFSTQTIKFLNEKWGSAGDPAPEGVEALLKRIGEQLGAVEETIAFGKRFESAIIVKVVACEDHPDADRLHVCKVDDGGKAQDVERDDQGLVQVVCGAPNVHEGMLAVWLPPGATVPSTIDTNEPFVLSARDFRGVTSNGMMASAKELGLGDDHDGILEITPDQDEHVEPGTLFADAYHLHDDVMIDIENKMFTHRPDLFGWLGLARELEGIQQRAYKSPEWYTLNPEVPGVEAEELPLEVTNDIPELVPRFVAIALRDIVIKPSPVWLQVDLARVGLRPINNVVDITNFLMMLTGQPIHAYDYDKVKALSGGDTAHLTVRFPREGEKIMLLNGKEITPRAEAMMVAAGDHLACLGGAMGGTNTEVDEHTKHVIIEAATWDMYSMRRTSMEHGIFTDAVTRFNKGQSPLQNLAVVAKVVDELCRHASAKVASPLIDVNHVPQAVRDRGSVYPSVTVTSQFINSRLGWELSADDMAQLLRNVECNVDVRGDELTVAAPFWRTDLELPEDLVEEVGRLYGYHQLPVALPCRDLTPAVTDPLIDLKTQIRDALADAGANEVLTYSFVHGNLLDKVGQSREQAFQLSNALSPDLQYFRLSLTPSLLERLHPNLKAGYDRFALFEINKTFDTAHATDDEGLPTEFQMLSLVVAANDKVAPKTAAFYDARVYLDYLAKRLNLEFTYTPLATEQSAPHAQPYDVARSALVSIKGGQDLGIIGEFKSSVLRSLKLPRHTAGFEINLTELLASLAEHQQSPYTPLPRFPKVEQDMCLKVSADTLYVDVYDFVAAHLDKQRPDKTQHTLQALDIYQKAGESDYKQITLRLQIASFERTLTDGEVAKLLDDVAVAAKQQLNAERV